LQFTAAAPIGTYKQTAMTLVSVIIPSHNRPELLREAVASVRHQTYKDWEIVIVDDGSQPPVDEQALRKEFGSPIRVIRNEIPMKQPYARDQGARAATGDVVVHLDDDDLLAPEALAISLATLEGDPSLELVYLGVRGFGERSSYFDDAQGRAIQRVLKQAQGNKAQPEVIRFGPELFGALLSSVPMAFQRSMEYRATWNKVSELRRRVYMLATDILDEEQAMRRLQPPLRESEWALYAAACCNTALLTTPIYLQRCDGQGYISISSQQEKAIHSGLDIKAHLVSAAKIIPEFGHWRQQIQESYSASYFNHAYFYFRSNRRWAAYAALIKAFWVRPAASHIKFALRMLLPRGAPPE
jgi:glycosyltransferase involved in cell wall biosynthesis